MKKNILKAVILVLALASILCFPVSASAQGTEGTEMEVLQPQVLEIQLGEPWAGVEFELKTDAGMYPDSIPVGADGVLRLEIGGSSSYILTCMDSSVKVPVPEETEPQEESIPSTTETESVTVPGTDAAGTATDPTSPTTEENSNTIAGIPVIHLVLFGGVLVLAIIALIVMALGKKNQDSGFDENDEF